MKKYIAWSLLLVLLSGCSDLSHELDGGMQLRSRLLQASTCSFTAEITAEDFERIYSFTVECTADKTGNVFFTVLEPDSISGISGKLTGQEGQIIFDKDMILQFPLLAEEQISPVSAPWIVLNALRSGFLASACAEDEEVRLSIDDTYNDNDLRLDVWLDQENTPAHVDILQDGRSILTMNVTKFEIS